MFTLPGQTFKFALNAVTDTLPHNKNLFLWRKVTSPKCQLCDKDQSLLHVLNGCQTALQLRCCNARYDSVLEAIYKFLCLHLPRDWSTTIDHPNHQYVFPQDIVVTDDRPDIVIWNTTSIHLVELTVPFEISISVATSQKEAKYHSLVEACSSRGCTVSLITLEVGFQGFVYMPGFNQMYKLVKAKHSATMELETAIIERAIEGSCNIWCKRNWLGDILLLHSLVVDQFLHCNSFGFVNPQY